MCPGTAQMAEANKYRQIFCARTHHSRLYTNRVSLLANAVAEIRGSLPGVTLMVDGAALVNMTYN